MIVVGVTGVLASGKTQTAKLFKSFGAKIFDADDCARRALKKGTPSYRAATQLFGHGFLLKSGEFDRKKLAEHVFLNPKDLKKLNTLLHPGVIFESLKFLKRFRNHKKVVVMDVPLLFESKMEGICDVTVVVSAKRTTLLRRVAQRGLTPALARRILDSQWGLKRKEKLADFVVHSDGTLGELKKQVKDIFLKIKK